MDGRALGVAIVAAGLVVVLVGLLVMAGAFSWFGRLPGDLRIESGPARVYVPVATMIVVSVVLTVAANVLRRLL